MTDTVMPQTVTTPMHLSLDPWWDRLTVLAYGRCDDALGDGQVLVDDVDERLRVYVESSAEDAPVLGFGVRQPWQVDLDAFDPDELWRGPRFDVPVLGLTAASIGEAVLAVRGQYREGEATADAIAFHAAIAAEDPADAAGHFKLALEAGDMAAHYGLGYSYAECGQFAQAYRHLRRYTEIVPSNAWAWAWLGRVCVALGELDEGRAALERAVQLDPGETDAEEQLADLVQ